MILVLWLLSSNLGFNRNEVECRTIGIALSISAVTHGSDWRARCEVKLLIGRIIHDPSLIAQMLSSRRR